MQINKRQLKKWIAALDSGEYPLRRRYDGRYLMQFAFPVPTEWLIQLNWDFGERTSISFTYLYDGKRWSLAEIATLLELVYIHKILD